MQLIDRDIQRDFETLIALMAGMINAPGGASLSADTAFRYDVETLSLKLFKQLCSARSLLDLQCYEVDDLGQIDFIDHSSVTILVRACIETYITMHWIFGNENHEHQRFRHTVWMLGGLQDRTRVHPTTEGARRKIAESRLQVNELIATIEASPYRSEYTPKELKEIRKGRWRTGWNWADAAARAGFNRKYFENVYGHFCGYAHSSYISTLQIGQARDRATQQALGQTTLQAALVVMAHFVHLHSGLFEESKAVFESAIGSMSIVQRWYIRDEDLSFVYDRDPV